MPVDGYIDIPFAVGGDVTAVPDGTQIDGSVSYEQGFPVLYSTATGSGGFNFPRRQFNQIMLDVTTSVQKLQQGSPPIFITSAMNGGSPYSYPKYAVVTLPSSGVAYQSLADSNTDTPPTSNWQAVPLGTQLLAANNLSDVLSASTSLSNLGGVSAAAVAAIYLSQSSAASIYAPLASPTFTGTPALPTGTTAITQAHNNNSVAVATTAYADQAGRILQVVHTADATYASGTTVIPFDNTIPQNTEGTEFTQIATAITPKSASSTLVIDAVVCLYQSGANPNEVIAAIFQDSIANALGVDYFFLDGTSTGNQGITLAIKVTVNSGSTTARTYKLRYGPGSGSDTTYINGNASGGLFGGVLKSSMQITEYL